LISELIEIFSIKRRLSAIASFLVLDMDDIYNEGMAYLVTINQAKDFLHERYN